MASTFNAWNVNFASDNVAGAAPEIMAALQEASTGFAMPYGDDTLTEVFRRRVAEIFETTLVAHPVATGTAANSLALSVLSPPYGVVFCHEGAHIEEDECAAPEFYIGGGKLTVLPGENGKFTADTLARKLGSPDAASAMHHAQPAAVSISQLTEKGTAYSLQEIRAIADVAHAHGLKLHMDGARFTNAMLSLGCSPAEATWKAGVDALSFGATKNGAFAAEAVIFFDPQAAQDFEFRRKRAAISSPKCGSCPPSLSPISKRITGFATRGPQTPLPVVSRMVLHLCPALNCCMWSRAMRFSPGFPALCIRPCVLPGANIMPLTRRRMAAWISAW